MRNQEVLENGTIHNIGDGFVISDDGGWLDGKYEDMESAKIALSRKHLFDWHYLVELTHKINVLQDRNIKISDFEELK